MALPNYSEIMELVKKGMTLEAQQKIIELREAALLLQEENLNLRERIRALEAAAAVRDSIVWNRPFYWRNLDAGGEDGPYCQRCYDAEEKLIRLQDLANGYWRCNKCSSTYSTGR